MVNILSLLMDADVCTYNVGTYLCRSYINKSHSRSSIALLIVS